MRIQVFIFSFLVLFCTSCRKKELPAEEIKDPHFYLNCMIDGRPLLLEAGKDNYYMHSSFFFDTSGVYVFKADLNQGCSQACGYSLTVMINDYRLSQAGAPISVDSALGLGEYLYNDKSLHSTVIKTVFKPDQDQDFSSSYSWTISDGESDNIYISSYQASEDLLAKKHYTVTLNVQDQTGCATEHTSVYTPGDNIHSNIIAVRSSVTQLSYSFSSEIKPAEEYSYLWQFGDGASSTDKTPLHVFAPKGGYYTTTLRLINSKNDTCISYYQIPGTLDQTCLANFSASFTPLPDLKLFSRVTVILTHPDGRVYSSGNSIQPDISSFNIVDISEYTRNKENYPTKKLKAKFNCVLGNGTEEIKLSNGEAVIAVAYE